MRRTAFAVVTLLGCSAGRCEPTHSRSIDGVPAAHTRRVELFTFHARAPLAGRFTKLHDDLDISVPDPGIARATPLVSRPRTVPSGPSSHPADGPTSCTTLTAGFQSTSCRPPDDRPRQPATTSVRRVLAGAVTLGSSGEVTVNRPAQERPCARARVPPRPGLATTRGRRIQSDDLGSQQPRTSIAAVPLPTRKVPRYDVLDGSRSDRLARDHTGKSPHVGAAPLRPAGFLLAVGPSGGIARSAVP